MAPLRPRNVPQTRLFNNDASVVIPEGRVTAVDVLDGLIAINFPVNVVFSNRKTCFFNR